MPPNKLAHSHNSIFFEASQLSYKQPAAIDISLNNKKDNIEKPE